MRRGRKLGALECANLLTPCPLTCHYLQRSLFVLAFPRMAACTLKQMKAGLRSKDSVGIYHRGDHFEALIVPPVELDSDDDVLDLT